MSEINFDVSILGLGYIGLPTATVLAEAGMRVCGFDVSKIVVDTVKSGKVHITEPNLAEIVLNVVKNGNLTACYELQSGDVYIIAVPTPLLTSSSTGIPEPDISHVLNACREIAPLLKSGDLVILESTSPIGTTENICNIIQTLRPDLVMPNHSELPDVHVAYCPERVLPGNILFELVQNDRVVGGVSTACTLAAANFYEGFVKGIVYQTNAKTAEMTKLAENSFRDTQIAFANELSMICDAADINVWELINLANRHPRVDILQPGPGVGGHCIAVDPWFIVSQDPRNAKIIKLAREVNDSKPDWVIHKIKKAVGECAIENPDLKTSEMIIACYGLAFKPDIADLRESPAVEIALKLVNLFPGQVIVVEPNVDKLPDAFSEIKHVYFNEAAEQADIHVLLVNHSEFTLAPRPKGKLVDTKGIWET